MKWISVGGKNRSPELQSSKSQAFGWTISVKSNYEIFLKQAFHEHVLAYKGREEEGILSMKLLLLFPYFVVPMKYEKQNHQAKFHINEQVFLPDTVIQAW